MELSYYVCGIGYDENYCVIDYEQCYGCFNSYEEAYEHFVKLQSKEADSFFTGAEEVYQLLIQVEECEENDGDITCIDVKNEWWVVNPHRV